MKKFLLIIFVVFSAFAASAQATKPAGVGTQPTIIRFYPNPATTVINFDFQKSYEAGYSIQVFNAILGRKMFEQNNMPQRMTVNLSEFNRGLYIYQLRDKNGRMVESGRFQVAK